MEKLNTEGMSVEDLRRIIANPFYAINIHPNLATLHEPLLSEDDWVKVGVKSIEENGAEDFLRHLLENLKGNYVASPEGEEVDGYKSE
tara:strand:- start:45 stop:308 length:264 start_codon:yes stop_codon:yes gene_type:complete